MALMKIPQGNTPVLSASWLRPDIGIPLRINASVILGYRMYEMIGPLVAILDTSLQPLLIISVISVFYAQFRSNRIITIALQVMRAGVAAVIFDVALSVAKKVVNARWVLYVLLMGLA